MSKIHTLFQNSYDNITLCKLSAEFKCGCTMSNDFSIVKVPVLLMPTGTLRKIMVYLRKIRVCSSLSPPLENKHRLKSI